MTGAELKEILEHLESQGVDLSEVKIKYAAQPNWPFEYTIGIHVVGWDEAGDKEDFVEGDDEIPTPEIWFYEQSQKGYLPEGISKELGWR